MNLITVQYTSANGTKAEYNQGKEYKCGLTIWPMEREGLFIPMVMFMQEIDSMIKPTVMDFVHI